MTLHRHKKRGSVYTKIDSEALFQYSGNPALEQALDGVKLTIYRDRTTGKYYVRPTTEFNDGRFEPVHDGDTWNS